MPRPLLRVPCPGRKRPVDQIRDLRGAKPFLTGAASLSRASGDLLANR